MILECKSCSKKFLVPDSAITSNGRLVQCSSCGNKWTQFPAKKENKVKKKQVQQFVSSTNITKPVIKKAKKIKKKTGPSIYSKEYLEQKHGIKINNKINTKQKNQISHKMKVNSMGFYSYCLITLIFLVFSLGVLNLTKEIIINYFPFTKEYIQYLFENLSNFIIIFMDMFNVY